jgi:3-hydroxyacyl-CoA dehydrogenase/enoyl-CoA hydratase/3-hydroxybutyryl-CoA epimerase
MYAMEGLALLNEGIPPVVIERLGMKAGMAQGPLAMLDEMSLATTLIFERRKQEHFTNIYYHQKEIKVLEKMVDELNREGAISKAGFYDYSDNTPRLWDGLKEHFEINETYPDEKQVIDRFMFVQAIEAVRTLEQGTIRSVEEANIGSIWGWNFPPFKGGVLQYINDYGLNNFIEQAAILEKQYGIRFSLPNLIQEKAEKGELF